MALIKADILRSIVAAHGLRPYDVIVEFMDEQAPNYFSLFAPLQWKQQPTKPGSLTVGYGADSYQFTFSMWDPDSTEAEHLNGGGSSLRIPKNGDFVVVTVKDQWAPVNGRVLFRGTIRAFHERTADAGKSYNCTALSEVTRLNDFHVTFVENFINDPVNPSPRFDNSNNVSAQPKLKTVVEIVQDIMNFKDAWQSTEFFQYNDIDWNGFDADPRCGLYVPPTITFENTPKGKAIQDVLQMAGNFTFVYIPQRNGRGKLRIIELNLACDACGDLWDINYAPNTVASQALTANYAFAYQMAEDNSDWNTVESANVIRMTTSQIRFYSGQWIIPERIDGDGDINCIQQEHDTPAQQKIRSQSHDGVNFRFTWVKDNHSDIRKAGTKIYPVGMPMYPDWNIHEDYLPATTEITAVQLPPSGPVAPMTANKYPGLKEFQTYTVGDEVNRGTPRLKHLDNLRAYQAWYSDTPCPACTPAGNPPGAPGLGLVNAVYTGANNEPSLHWEAVTPNGSRRTMGPTDTLQAGERLIYTVTNYIFNPKDFGSPTASFAGLSPWAGTTIYYKGGLPQTSSYPLPWKNLCPFCRGTGMKPMWKIRNVQPDLFSGRNNQIAQPSGVAEIPVDPDFTQTAPETWEQTQNRLTLRESAWLAVESPIDRPQLPIYQNRNWDFKQLKTLPVADQHNQFPNPLSFFSLQKRIPQQFGNFNATNETVKLVPDSWTCEVPYTTVFFGVHAPIDTSLGRVMFEEPQVIPCRKQYSEYIRFDNGTFLVGTDGALVQKSLGRGQIMADRNFNGTGFWRHARVWMQFFYIRDLYYHYMFTDKDGNPVPDTTFTYPTPDGGVGHYKARTSIHDGRLAIEVQKTNPSQGETGGTLFPTGNRVLQKCLTDQDTKIETTYADLFKMPLPTVVSVQPAELEAHKRTVFNLDFPRARLFKMERTSPGEIAAEMAGYISTDYATSFLRPKIYSWRLRDDRSRLLGKCLRELETANNLRVSGTMRMIGVSHDIANGLGFINKPNKGKAAVVRIEYNFTEAMQCEIDISREEARFGEPIPTAEELMNQVNKTVVTQGRVMDMMRSMQSSQVNNPSPPSQINEISTSSAGIYRGL